MATKPKETKLRAKVKVKNPAPKLTRGGLTTKEQRRKELENFPSRRELLNAAKKRLLLECLAIKGTIYGACKLAGISRTTYAMWSDPNCALRYGMDPAAHYDAAFQEAALEALVSFRQRVLQTGIDRALDGWTDEKYDRNGVLMSKEQKYDSAILQMLMKKADPELKEKAATVNVDASTKTLTVNGNTQSAQVLDTLTPLQKRLLLKAMDANKAENPDSGPALLEGEVLSKTEDA